MRLRRRLHFVYANRWRPREEEERDRQSNAKRLHRNSIRRNSDSRFRVCQPTGIKSTCSCGETPKGDASSLGRAELRCGCERNSRGPDSICSSSYRSQVPAFLQAMDSVFWADGGLMAVPHTVHVLHQPQGALPQGVPRRGSGTSGTTSLPLAAAAKQARPSAAWPAGESAESSAAVAAV